MFGYINLIKDLCDLSILVDEESLTVDAHVLLSVHALFDPHTVLLDDVLLGIGYEVELQPILRLELLM